MLVHTPVAALSRHCIGDGTYSIAQTTYAMQNPMSKYMEWEVRLNCDITMPQSAPSCLPCIQCQASDQLMYVHAKQQQ